ncbi:MAG: hypothetical protein ACTSQ8_22610 [Candidatus Helarchaeota archaeon]
MTETSEIDVRLLNRKRSDKRGGSSLEDSEKYLNELNIDIIPNSQPIQFSTNINERVHRWAPYVQGFSSSFVQSQIDKFRDLYPHPKILDPFAGCGTVLVQSKFNGIESFGVEINPLMQFIANMKINSWDIYPNYLMQIYYSLDKSQLAEPPKFLKSEKHFLPGVLENLLRLKHGIDSFEVSTENQKKIVDLIKVAFSSILIDSSNLKRAPCLGYVKNKNIEDSTPFVLLNQKIENICDDLRFIQDEFSNLIDSRSEIYLENSKDFVHRDQYDLVITSPPYMNGMDYVINYKIEMAWLDFADEQKELRNLKNGMVVCDNVSKHTIRSFAKSKKQYSNEWIEAIKNRININIEKRGGYRRMDMANIVHKYFDDMWDIMSNTVPNINSGGRFILVVGDSLIADTYLPTDLLIARMGRELGLEIESIEQARERRSGQIRSYKLRESIITLRKQ